MKYIGLILILISSILIGLYIRNTYAGRVLLLEKCIEMLNLISINLSYIGLDTISILKMLINESSMKSLTFIECCLSRINQGNGFQDSWNDSLNSFGSYLKGEDIDILISFGSLLGKSDIDGQINNCNINIQKLTVNLNSAKESYDKYANLYFRLSVLSGILISLIII